MGDREGTGKGQGRDREGKEGTDSEGIALSFFVPIRYQQLGFQFFLFVRKTYCHSCWRVRLTIRFFLLSYFILVSFFRILLFHVVLSPTFLAKRILIDFSFSHD